MKKRRIAAMILSFLLVLQLITALAPITSSADNEDVAEHVRAVMEVEDGFDFDSATAEGILARIAGLEESPEEYYAFCSGLTEAQGARLWAIQNYGFDLTYASDSEIISFFDGLMDEDPDACCYYMDAMTAEEYARVIEALGEEAREIDGESKEAGSETETAANAEIGPDAETFESNGFTYTVVGSIGISYGEDENTGIAPMSTVGSSGVYTAHYDRTINYGSSHTYYMTVQTGSGTFPAFCADATASTPVTQQAPSRNFTVASVTRANGDQVALINTLIVCGEHGELADTYRSYLYAGIDNGNSDYRYAVLHEAISLVYSGKNSNAMRANAQTVRDRAAAIMGNADVQSAVSRTTLYVFSLNDELGINNAQDVIWGETAPATGAIRVTKASSNAAYTASSQAASRFPLSGITFGLYTDQGCTNRVATAVTNAQGVASFNNIHIGTYYVREDALPANTLWVRNTTPNLVTVSSGATASTTIRNTPQSGFLQVRKESANTTITSSANPGCYSYAGIQFYVYRDSACTNRAADINGNPIVLTTNAQGVTNTVAVLPGTYFVKEVSVPENSGWSENLPAAQRVVVTNYGAAANASNTTVVTITNVPETDPAGVIITKLDANGEVIEGYDLSGARYQFNYYNGQYTSVSALPAAPTYTWVTEVRYNEAGNVYRADLDAAHVVSGEPIYGVATVGAYKIPLGTLTVQEIQAPEYFSIAGRYEADNGNVSATNIALFNIVGDHRDIQVHAGNSIMDTDEPLMLTMYENYACGGLVIDKNDSDTNGAPQGDADLSGIRYAVFSNIDRTILVDGNYYENGDLVAVLTTNAAGNAQTGANYLPLGEYIVRELRMDAVVEEDENGVLTLTSEGTSDRANMYYAYDGTEQTVNITTEGSRVTASFENEVARLQIAVRKFDADTATNTPEGGATLEGIGFDLINRSVNQQVVVVGGETFVYGETIATAYTDEEGIVDFGVELPYGSYGVQEFLSDNNGSYLITDGEEHIVAPAAALNDEGEVVYTFIYSDARAEEGEAPEYEAFYNYVIRGGVEFNKVDEDGEPIGLVPFRITNIETGEVHYIITDEEGFYSSEYNDHTANTNGNDEALCDYTEADIIPMEVLESLDLEAGTWFGNGEPDDDLYALSFGTYHVEELKCEHTASMNMVSFDFTIGYQGQFEFLGDVENIAVEIHTTAINDETGDHYAAATEEASITDKVEYINLIPGVEYVIDGTLMLVEENEDGEVVATTPVRNADGTPVTGQTIFTPEESFGEVDVTFTFDASALEGHDTVVFEVMHKTLTGEFVCDHKDPADEDQTIHFPEIHTTAVDSETEDHIAKADEEVTLVDTVEYSGLPVGEEFTVTGTLMDKATGEAVLDDDGNVITADTTFTPEESDGTVGVTFVFNGVSDAGTTTVAFEEIRHDGKLYAVHADINDEDQTVDFPEIHTTATGDAGEDRVSVSAAATITDTVQYTNLIPGRTYVITGTLMNKNTGEAVDGVRETVEFVPDAPCGSIDVVFTVDTRTLQGAQLVVFEDVSVKIDNELVSVGEHKDPDDEGQTVTVNRTPVPGTGDSTPIWFYVYVMLAAAFAMVAAVITIRNSKKKDI